MLINIIFFSKILIKSIDLKEEAKAKKKLINFQIIIREKKIKKFFFLFNLKSRSLNYFLFALKKNKFTLN